jgi:hypothetical protein
MDRKELEKACSFFAFSLVLFPAETLNADFRIAAPAQRLSPPSAREIL